MNILEHIYDINFHKINFYERKVCIENKKTLLLGPPKSGKSYLIYDYLSRYKDKEYIYIDFEEYKNNTQFIAKHLEEFLSSHPIKVVVFENFSFQCEIPKNIESVIITTSDKEFIEDFETLVLLGLDFEEFLLFDTKHLTSSNSFNSFLKFGNFPEIIELSEHKKTKRNYEICKLYCVDTTQLEILFILIKNAGEKKSIFQLFNSLKREIKISKDRFYTTVEFFRRNKVIYLCSKYQQPKAVKKIFICNHALLDDISYKKNFNNLFKNMVFLELNKRYEEIVYLDEIDFYLVCEKEIVLSIPFFNTLLSSALLSKIVFKCDQFSIESITIVTIGTSETLFIGEIETQIVPFRSWAVSL